MHENDCEDEYLLIKDTLEGKESVSTYKGSTQQVYECEGWIDRYYQGGKYIGRFKGTVCFELSDRGALSESHYLSCRGHSPDEGGGSYQSLGYYIERYHLKKKEEKTYGEQLTLF